MCSFFHSIDYLVSNFLTQKFKKKFRGVKRVIFSSQVDADGISQNKVHVPHFTMKYKIEKYMRQIGLDVAAIAPAFYYQNWMTFFPPRKEGDKWTIALPSSEGSYFYSFICKPVLQYQSFFPPQYQIRFQNIL